MASVVFILTAVFPPSVIFLQHPRASSLSPGLLFLSPFLLSPPLLLPFTPSPVVWTGGDWALQRTGAVFVEGTEGFTIQDSNFTRLDGNAVMISGYHRDLVIQRNEVRGCVCTLLVSEVFLLPALVFGFGSYVRRLNERSVAILVLDAKRLLTRAPHVLSSHPLLSHSCTLLYVFRLPSARQFPPFYTHVHTHTVCVDW